MQPVFYYSSVYILVFLIFRVYGVLPHAYDKS